MEEPRAVRLMVPAAVVDGTIADLLRHLETGDILIDGGNSYYVDVGTSGGVWGLERGYCMTIGGEEGVVMRLDPIFSTLAPGVGGIPRTPGRETLDGTAEQGYLYCGPNGRPLRQDGPQRDRVRRHGRLRGGIRRLGRR